MRAPAGWPPLTIRLLACSHFFRLHPRPAGLSGVAFERAWRAIRAGFEPAALRPLPKITESLRPALYGAGHHARRAFLQSGSGGRVRTGNLAVNNRLLSPLSYSQIPCPRGRDGHGAVVGSLLLYH